MARYWLRKPWLRYGTGQIASKESVLPRKAIRKKAISNWLCAAFRSVRLGFGFQAREKLSGQHVRGALDDPLANTGQQSANVDLRSVSHRSSAFGLHKVEHSISFHEPRLALAFDHERVVFRSVDVFESNRRGKHAFDRAHTGAELGVVFVSVALLELLAPGNAFLQNVGIDQRGEDAPARGGNCLRAFNLHWIG